MEEDADITEDAEDAAVVAMNKRPHQIYTKNPFYEFMGGVFVVFSQDS